MYNVPSFLPNTGAAMSLWLPLAAVAILLLGVSLIRAFRTFKVDEEEE